jgi:hypothetical protein
VWTGTNSFQQIPIITSTAAYNDYRQLTTKDYVDVNLNTKQPIITSAVDVTMQNGSIANLTIRQNLNVNSVLIPYTTLSNLQYLDIASSLTTLLAAKQNTITSSTTISCSGLTCTSGTVNGNLNATGQITNSNNNMFSCNICN